MPGASYAVVSQVPGLNADDPALVIRGTRTAGTEAQFDFLLNASAFGQPKNRGWMPHIRAQVFAKKGHVARQARGKNSTNG